MLDRGSLETEEILHTLKTKKGIPASCILIAAGYPPSTVTRYTPEERDREAAIIGHVSTAEIKLLNLLEFGGVTRDIPDVLEIAIQQPETIFGTEYPLMSDFGHRIDRYGVKNWQRALTKHQWSTVDQWRYDQQVRATWAFTLPLPHGPNYFASQRISIATRTAFTSATREAFLRSGAICDSEAHFFSFTHDAGSAAAEILAGIEEPRFVPLFQV